MAAAAGKGGEHIPTWEEICARFPPEEIVPPPAPEVAAVYAENQAKLKEDLKLLDVAIKTAPIYLCSNHGIYDRSKELVERRVPPNTFVFEAQNIGDLTLADIDKPLWELLQGGHRWGFLKYLKNSFRGFKERGLKERQEFKDIFSNLILYKPGDTIYARNLSIGGGRIPVIGSARVSYQNMGFYKFDANGPAYPYRGYGVREKGAAANPYEILPHLQTDMVENGELTTSDCDIMDILGRTIPARYIDGISMGPDVEADIERALHGIDPAGLRIFIFSSCAAVEADNSPEGVARWVKIAAVQRERILESWQMGLLTLGGGSGSPIAKRDMKKITDLAKKQWDSGYNLRGRRVNPAGFVGKELAKVGDKAISEFSQADADLDAEHLYDEGGGGGGKGGRRRTHRRKFKKTRRFLKKSKRTLKRRGPRGP